MTRRLPARSFLTATALALSAFTVPAFAATRIEVSNLNYNATEDDIGTQFKTFGEVCRVSLLKHAQGTKSTGHAILDMRDDTAAQQAINSLNNTMMQGQKLTVRKSTSAASGCAAPKPGPQAGGGPRSGSTDRNQSSGRSNNMSR